MEARARDGLARGAGARRAGCAPSRRPTRSTLLRRGTRRRGSSATSPRSASLLANVHPLLAVRTACEQAEVEVDRLRHRAAPGPRRSTTCSRPLDPAGLDPVAARLLDEDPRRLPAGRRRPRRRHPRPAGGDQRAADRRSARSSAAPSATTSAPSGCPPERLAGLPQDWLDAHPADDDGPGHRHDRLPRRRPGADVRPRRRACAARSPSRSSSAAGRRTSRCSPRCSRCATSSPRWSATPTGRRTTPT